MDQVVFLWLYIWHSVGDQYEFCNWHFAKYQDVEYCIVGILPENYHVWMLVICLDPNLTKRSRCCQKYKYTTILIFWSVWSCMKANFYATALNCVAVLPSTVWQYCPQLGRITCILANSKVPYHPCQLNKLSTDFTGDRFPPGTTSPTLPKAQTWLQFNRRAILPSIARQQS